VCQHEIDHLHGVLFIEKMGAIAKLSSRGTLKEFERDFRKAQQRGEIPLCHGLVLSPLQLLCRAPREGPRLTRVFRQPGGWLNLSAGPPEIDHVEPTEDAVDDRPQQRVVAAPRDRHREGCTE